MTVDGMRRVLGVLLVAVAFAAGGCGDDQTAKYRDDVKAALGPLRATFATTKERTAAAHSLKQRIAALDQGRRALETAAAKLEKLDPPADARVEHDDFVRQLPRYADDIRRFERAANDNDPPAVKRALDALRSDPAHLKRATDALKAKIAD